MPDSKQALTEAIRNTTEVIAMITIPLPINSKLILTRQKLVYEKGTLFSRHVYSIEPKGVINVTASIGPIFGIIYFSHEAKDFPKQIGLIWRKDAIRMKRIIDGYILANRQNINISDIEAAELLPMLVKLGTDDPSVKD